MRSLLILLPFLALGCPPASESEPSETAPGESEPDDTEPGVRADVEAVSWAGETGAYTFTVTLRSPDVDCSQYADWWEVLTAEGGLVYRRILNHSHPDEQPFARSGEPIEVGDGDRLVVRGHMNEAGYGGVAYSGSVADGFAADASITAAFAAEVESHEPQVEDCWY